MKMSKEGIRLLTQAGGLVMKMSKEGIRLLTQLEGFETTVYKDVAGLPTIGVGHLLTQDELSSGKLWIGDCFIRYHQGLTRQQVEDLLAQDLITFEATVLTGVKRSLTSYQFDALVSLAFNIGTRAFLGSTLLKRINAGLLSEVPYQMRRWVYAGGKRIKGLENRREKEINHWLGV